MTKEEFRRSLYARKDWYQKSLDMKKGKIPWENGYNWPDGDVQTWEGAVRELKNTLDMLNCISERLTVSTPIGSIITVPKKDRNYPGVHICLEKNADLDILATIEANPFIKKVQMVSYAVIPESDF